MSEIISVTGIDIQPKAIDTVVGRTESIQASVYPTNATNKGVQWVVKDKTVIRSNGDGTFTALKKGSTAVTAVSDDGGYTKAAWFDVWDEDDVRVNDIVLYSKSCTIRNIEKYILGYGESDTIVARCLSNYDYSLDKNGVLWKSSNPEIATVSDDGGYGYSGSYWKGKITAGNVSGTAIITATSKTSPDIKADFTVIVKPQVKHIKSFSIVPETLEIAIGQKYQLSAVFNPSDADNKRLYWKVPIGSTVSVNSSGLAQGVRQGTTTISATSEDGEILKNIVINVTDSIVPLSKLELDKYFLRIEVPTETSSPEYLIRVYVPATSSSSDIGVNVSIKDPSICKVDSIKRLSEGSNRVAIYFKALKPGYTTAAITSKADSTKSATLEIMSLPSGKVHDVYLPHVFYTLPDTIEVERGQVFTILATGFGGQRYSNNYKDPSIYPLWPVAWLGSWTFTSNSSQLESIKEVNDTNQTRKWFRAGYIPGDYEITVKRDERFDGASLWGTKKVKVKIVDKLFDNPIGELIPSTWYIAFKDEDEISYSDTAKGFVSNPYKFYFGKIQDGGTSESAVRLSDSETQDIGWKISRDGIISKIEYSGSYLKIYRGPNYGITQVIFYLKSNPHITYPCWVSHSSGDFRYYMTDKNMTTSGQTEVIPASTSTPKRTGESTVVVDSVIYKTSYNPDYNYNSDTGLQNNSQIETKIKRKTSSGSSKFKDPRFKNGSTSSTN